MANQHPQRPRRTSLTSCALVWTVLYCGACEGAKLQEPAPNLDILQVLPASATLQVGETATLGALRLKDGHTVNATSSADWASDDEAVVIVSYDGDSGAVVEAMGPGTAHITASTGDASASAEFIVIAEVSAIELDNSVLELASGTSLPLGAIVIAADGTKREPDATLAWGTSDATVASVDADGVLQGIEAGDVIITAIYEGHTTSQPIRVSAWTLESISASAVAGTTLPLGGATDVEVTGHFQGGRTQDITSLFTLETAPGDPRTDEEPVLTIDAATVTAGSAAGSAPVTGAGAPNSIADGQTFSLDFAVVDTPLSALELDAPETLSTQGELGAFTLTGIYGDELRFPADADFTSDPEGIVYVDAASGTILALAPGTAQITASVTLASSDDADDQAPQTIEVSHDITVVDDAIEELTIALADDGSTQPLAVGASISLAATAAFGAVDAEDVTDAALWTSDDETVAVVSNVTAGRVTLLRPGTTTITATYKGKSATFSIRGGDGS
jgi:uncharacterized protein YjdB